MYVALPDYNGYIGALLSNISKNICTIVLENIMQYLFFCCTFLPSELIHYSVWIRVTHTYQRRLNSAFPFIDAILSHNTPVCTDHLTHWLLATYIYYLPHTLTTCHLHWLLSTYIDYLSLTLTTCHLHWLLATYIDYFPLTLTTFHLHWLLVTYIKLLSTYIDYFPLTLTTCHLHWLLATYIDYLSLTLTTCHLHC